MNTKSNTKSNKPDGWFSRRHASRDAHDEARRNYRTKVDRQIAAEVNAELRGKRSNSEQVAILDARLGAGQGARKERERLSA